MSESLRPDLSRAERFQALHIFLPTDYGTYQQEMLLQWKENAEEALEAGEHVRPLWLRRTDEMGSEFAAIIDYVMPTADGVLYLAAIDIDATGGANEISVLLPKEDGSGEPVRVTHEAYTLPALQRAIEYVETNVQPREN